MRGWLDNLGPVFLSDPVNRQHPLNQGRTAWWLATPGLDGGSHLYDLMGLYSGTLAAGAKWTSPIQPGGFAAVNFATGNGLSTNLGFQSPFTFLWWCVVPSGANSVVFSHASGSLEGLFFVGAGVAGQLGFGPTATVSSDWSQAPTTQATGSVHHYGIGYNGTTAAWWVDGIRTGTTTPAKQNTSAATGLRIGARANNSLPLTKSLDDFTSFNRVLSDAEVEELYTLSRLGYPGVLNRLAPPLRPAAAAGPAGNNPWRPFPGLPYPLLAS